MRTLEGELVVEYVRFMLHVIQIDSSYLPFLARIRCDLSDSNMVLRDVFFFIDPI